MICLYLIINLVVIRPKIVAYQIVTNLTNTTETVANVKSVPYLTSKPNMLPSVTKRPPGMNESTPDNMEVKNI